MRSFRRNIHHVLLVCALPFVTAALIARLDRLVSKPIDARAKSRLRLVSWNVGRVYLSADSRLADRNVDHIAAVLRELEADVAALQELSDERQLTALTSALGRPWHGHIPQDRYDRRAAIVTRLPAEFFELPTSSGRTAQAMRVSLYGAPTTVVSLHLDAFDSQRRLQQAEEIVAHSLRQTSDSTILAGDFNVDPDSSELNPTDRELTDFLRRYFQDAAQSVGSTTITSRRLDHIYFRGAALVGATARSVLDRRVGLMDHDPLLVDLEIRDSKRVGPATNTK